MKRRQFLGTMGGVAPGALALPLASSAMAESKVTQNLNQSEEPRVFFYDDGRHAADLYCFEPPVTPADHSYIVDQLAGSGVDALVYFAGVEGGTALYDSKVAQLWGDEVKKWTHYVWYRAGRILRQLVDQGHDPLKILCDRCHETGLLMIASAWVSLEGGTRTEHEGMGRWSAFAMDNPQFKVGIDPDPRAEGILKTRFNFLHEEVRNERFRLFEEMLTRYETDGIELNLTMTMPFCRFGQVSRLAPIMTQWIRELREVADKAEQDQKRRKRIYARIPAHPEAWKLVGYDVPTWVAEELIDGFFCEGSYNEDEGMVQDVDCTTMIQLARGTRCRVIFASHNNLGRQFARHATGPMIWAGAANAYDQGVDGIAMADHCWTPHGWPWTADDYHTLRLLGNPKLLAVADKYYMVRSTTPNQSSMNWMPGRSDLLPKEILEGKSIEVSFRVADDVAYWRKLGRVKSVILRVRFGTILPDDEVHVEFNHQRLPDSILKKVDMTYRMTGQISSSHSIGPYGYAYDYHLGPEHDPSHGRNFLKVTLLKRDPDIAANLSLLNVDCKIEYRLHRNFERRPIEYSDDVGT